MSTKTITKVRKVIPRGNSVEYPYGPPSTVLNPALPQNRDPIAYSSPRQPPQQSTSSRGYVSTDIRSTNRPYNFRMEYCKRNRQNVREAAFKEGHLDLTNCICNLCGGPVIGHDEGEELPSSPFDDDYREDEYGEEEDNSGEGSREETVPKEKSRRQRRRDRQAKRKSNSQEVEVEENDDDDEMAISEEQAKRAKRHQNIQNLMYSKGRPLSVPAHRAKRSRDNSPSTRESSSQSSSSSSTTSSSPPSSQSSHDFDDRAQRVLSAANNYSPSSRTNINSSSTVLSVMKESNKKKCD